MKSGLIALALLLAASATAADTIYVDQDATGANTGATWVDAFLDLQDALSVAVAGDEIRVAAGTYLPAEEADYESTFILANGVRLLGGFAGGMAGGDARDVELHETVLDGGFGPPDYEIVSERLIQLVDTDSTTVLDGFVIRGAAHAVYIDGGNPILGQLHITDNIPGFVVGGSGALRLSNDARPLVHDSTFSLNRTYQSGGAVYTPWDTTSDPRFERVVFENNRCAEGNGGAVFGSGTFVDCVFQGNNAENTGGAVSGPATFIRCEFRDNHTRWLYGGGGAVAGGGYFEDVLFEGNYTRNGGHGGAVLGDATFVRARFINNQVAARRNEVYPFWEGGAFRGTGTFVNCLIVGGLADLGGAVAGEVELIQCTVVGNEARETGDAAYLTGAASSITNSVVWGNGAGASQLLAFDAAPSVLHSILEASGGSGMGWDTAFGADLGGNLDQDPMFADPSSGDFQLMPGSPGIDAGLTSAVPDDVLTDLAGNPRFMNLAVDMGAYEASGPLSIGEDLPPRPDVRRYLRVSPTPFNATTTVYFGLDRASQVTITIYDLAGRKVKTLRSGHVQAGDHDVRWHGQDDGGRVVASGVYVCRMQGDGFVEAQRLVLVK